MPRVPFQTLVAARQNEAPIQSGAFQQTAQATANLMGAIGGAAQTVKSMFDQAQDLKNRSEIMEKRRTIRQSQGDFLNEMAGMRPDGSMGQPVPAEEWGVRWKQRLEQMESQLGLNDSKVPPVVRRSVGEVFKDFAGTSYIQIAGAALKETRRNARQNFDMTYKTLIDDERYDEAKEFVSENVGPLLTEEEGNFALNNIDKADRNNAFDRELLSDPIGTIEKIKNNEFGFPPTKNAEMLDRAQRVQRQKENESLAAINELLDAGEIEDEDDLKMNLENDIYIDETTQKAFLKEYQQVKPLTDAEKMNLRDMVDGLVQYRDNPDKYEEEFDKVVKEFELVERRKNKPMVNLYNIRPEIIRSRYENASDTERARLNKDLATTGRSVIQARVEATVENDFASRFIAKEDGGDGLTPEQKKKNRKLEAERDEQIAVMRGVFNEAWEEYLAMVGENASARDLDPRIWLDKNQNEIMAKALEKWAEQSGKSEPRLRMSDELETAGDTMLPRNLFPPIGPGN